MSYQNRQVSVGFAYILAMLFVFSVLIFGAIGWVLNIVAVVGADFANITGMLVVRIVGIVIPFVGAVMGWFF